MIVDAIPSIPFRLLFSFDGWNNQTNKNTVRSDKYEKGLTLLVSILGLLGGGGAEIRTLAGAEPHYRFSRPTPSAAWVRLLTKMVVHRWLEHRT